MIASAVDPCGDFRLRCGILSETSRGSPASKVWVKRPGDTKRGGMFHRGGVHGSCGGNPFALVLSGVERPDGVVDGLASAGVEKSFPTASVVLEHDQVIDR